MPRGVLLVLGGFLLLLMLNGFGIYLVVSSRGSVLGSILFFPFEVIHKVIPTNPDLIKSLVVKGAAYVLPLTNLVLLWATVLFTNKSGQVAPNK